MDGNLHSFVTAVDIPVELVKVIVGFDHEFHRIQLVNSIAKLKKHE